MHSTDTNLARLDLNLLTALHALLTHASVSEAAHSVGRTQSAMSHSLARLRSHFHDSLLVRDGWAMKLTPLAETLRPKVLHVARAVDALFDGQQPFDAATSNRIIRIATRDICVPLLAPLIARIARAGPDLTIEIQEPTNIRASVTGSDADIGFGFGAAKSDTNLDARAVGSVQWCVFAPDGHAYTQEHTVEQWVAAPHIMVGTPGQQTGPVEARAAELGLSRHVLCHAPNFNAALALAVECGALFTTLQQPFSGQTAPRGLQPCPMPFAMPDAPAVLTLRRDWGNPFQLWLAKMCNGFSVG